jgi:hypothetical protein
MLRSADRTRDATATGAQSRVPIAAHDQDLKDLASLIGSLDIDLTKTVTKERPRAQGARAGVDSEVMIAERLRSESRFPDGTR